MIPIDARASDVCQLLGLPLQGDFRLQWIAAPREAVDGAVVFLGSQPDDSTMNALRRAKRCLLLAKDGLELEGLDDSSVTIRLKQPRLAMARVLSWTEESGLLRLPPVDGSVSRTASVSALAFVAKTASLGDRVVVEPFAFVGDRVVIGEDSVIKAGVRLVARVTIGKRSVIRENSVIGGSGFGIERDEAGRNLRIPHLGGVIIGDDVEIGALNTVCSGTLGPTVVGEHVKTDDHCHIAHNVALGRNAIITAGAVFSGSVRCGDAVWVGPNASVMQGIRVGAGAVVGMGAVVTREVPAGATVAGSPARSTKELVRVNAALRALIERENADEGE